jgi:molecular chaperone DnaJ
VALPVKNYYTVLGIPRTENRAGIRFAYHELTSHMHPDRAAHLGTHALQEVNEAYAVLSDPVQRQSHDEQLEGLSRTTEIPVTYTSPVEPLTPKPVSLFARPERTVPSFEPFFERYARNFTGRHVPKAERPESLTVDVVLSPLEATIGCWLPIGVPGFRPCRHCGGAGNVWLFPCVECRGSGIEEFERVMQVRVPPFVPAGTVLEAALDVFGVENLYLRVHISISEEAL